MILFRVWFISVGLFDLAFRQCVKVSTLKSNYGIDLPLIYSKIDFSSFDTCTAGSTCTCIAFGTFVYYNCIVMRKRSNIRSKSIIDDIEFIFIFLIQTQNYSIRNWHLNLDNETGDVALWICYGARRLLSFV